MGEWNQNVSWGDWLRECRLDPVGSGLGPVVDSCEYGDKPSCSGATELVRRGAKAIKIWERLV
jgi:hypothetical protein